MMSSDFGRDFLSEGLGRGVPGDGLLARSEVTTLLTTDRDSVSEMEGTLVHIDGLGASRRQADFDREIENADRQQAELFNLQWRLIRDQMGGFAREITALRQEFTALKLFEKQQEARHTEHERRSREDFGVLVKKIDAEMQTRMAENDKVQLHFTDFGRAVDGLRSLVDAEVKELHKFPAQLRLEIEQETRNRREAGEEQSATFRESYASLVDDLRKRDAADAETRRLAQKLQQNSDREVHDRIAGDDEIKHLLTQADANLEHETVQRVNDFKNVQVVLKELRMLIESTNQELSSHKKEVETLESTQTTQFRDLKGCLEQESGNRERSLQRLEQQCSDANGRLDQLQGQVVANKDELLGAIRTMKTTVDQERDSGHSGLKGLMEEASQREKMAREAHHNTIQDSISQYKSSLDVHQEKIQGHLQNEKQARQGHHDTLQERVTQLEMKYREDLIAHKTDWQSGHASLQQSLNETSNRDKACREIHRVTLEELQRFPAQLREALEEESRQRKDGDEEQLLGLKEGLASLAADIRKREMDEAEIARLTQKIRQTLDKEIQERCTSDETGKALLSQIQANLEQETTRRENECKNVQVQVKNLQTSLESSVTDASAQKIVVETVESSTSSLLKEFKLSLETETGHRERADARLEQLCADAQSRLDQLQGQHVAAKDDLFSTIRTMKATVDQERDTVHNKLKADMEEASHREKMARDTHQGTVQDNIAHHKANQEGHQEKVNGIVQSEKQARKGHYDAIMERIVLLEAKNKEDLESHMCQTQDNLSKESSVRGVALAKCVTDLKEALASETTSRKSDCNELKDGLVAETIARKVDVDELKDAVATECDTRSKELVSETNSRRMDINELKEALGSETGARKVDINQMKDALASEVSSRNEGLVSEGRSRKGDIDGLKEMLASEVHSRKESLVLEAKDRKVELDSLKGALASETEDRKEALTSEANTRKEGHTIEAKARKVDVDGLKEALASEAEDRKEALASEANSRKEGLISETKARKVDVDGLKETLASEAEDRKEALISEANSRKEALISEAQARKVDVDGLKEALAAEANARKEALASEATARKDGLAWEAKARKVDVDGLKGTLASEADARKEADAWEANARKESLSSEASARKVDVNQLREHFSSEITARKDSIKELKESIVCETETREEDINDLREMMGTEKIHRESHRETVQIDLDRFQKSRDEHALQVLGHVEQTRGMHEEHRTAFEERLAAEQKRLAALEDDLQNQVRELDQRCLEDNKTVNERFEAVDGRQRNLDNIVSSERQSRETAHQELFAQFRQESEFRQRAISESLAVEQNRRTSSHTAISERVDGLELSLGRVESLERQTSLFEGIAREEKKAREDEVKRLWNAVDSHTHDFGEEPQRIATPILVTTTKQITAKPAAQHGILQRSMTMQPGTSRSLAYSPGQTTAVAKKDTAWQPAPSPRTLKTMASMAVPATYAGAPPPQAAASHGRLMTGGAVSSLTSPGRQGQRYVGTGSGSGNAPVGGGASPSRMDSSMTSFQMSANNLSTGNLTGSLSVSPGSVLQSPRQSMTPRDQTYQYAMAGAAVGAASSAYATQNVVTQSTSGGGGQKCGAARYSNRGFEEEITTSTTSVSETLIEDTVKPRQPQFMEEKTVSKTATRP